MISGEAVFVEPKGGTKFRAHVRSPTGTLGRNGCTSWAKLVAGPVPQLTSPKLATSRPLPKDVNEKVCATGCTFGQEKKPRSGFTLNGALGHALK